MNSDEGIIEEVEKSADMVPNSVVLINPSVSELSSHLERRRPLLHIAGHAAIDPVQGSLSWLETPDGHLTSRDLIDMKFQADTIVRHRVSHCQANHFRRRRMARIDAGVLSFRSPHYCFSSLGDSRRIRPPVFKIFIRKL